MEEKSEREEEGNRHPRRGGSLCSLSVSQHRREPRLWFPRTYSLSLWLSAMRSLAVCGEKFSASREAEEAALGQVSYRSEKAWRNCTIVTTASSEAIAERGWLQSFLWGEVNLGASPGYIKTRP